VSAAEACVAYEPDGASEEPDCPEPVRDGLDWLHDPDLGDGNDGYALFIEPAVVGGWDSAAVTVSPVDGDGDDGEVFRFRVFADSYGADGEPSPVPLDGSTDVMFVLADPGFAFASAGDSPAAISAGVRRGR
jgi:hypothetical protein